jgi:uncharacterized RmlC-like cupin family protein
VPPFVPHQEINAVAQPDEVLGVITKEHVADSVAASVEPYT